VGVISNVNNQPVTNTTIFLTCNSFADLVLNVNITNPGGCSGIVGNAQVVINDTIVNAVGMCVTSAGSNFEQFIFPTNNCSDLGETRIIISRTSNIIVTILTTTDYLTLCPGGVFNCTSCPACNLTFFQGFEENTDGWDVFTPPQFDAIRVPNGTHDVPSAAGNFNAEAGQFDLDNDGGSAASNLGCYSCCFGGDGTNGTGGFNTSVDVYLDVGITSPNDVRFDLSTAVSAAAASPNSQTCGFRRDFVFNVGYYNDTTTAPGDTPRFIISASNNAGRSGSNPFNPANDPVAVTETGWYTFGWRFYNDGGVLAVEMTLTAANGTVINTWTLSDPSDLIELIGGNRYMWFASQEFPFLSFDNSFRESSPCPEPEPTTIMAPSTMQNMTASPSIFRSPV
ncbi:Hypothetical protein POVN_LOCUS97, partial [uncultured virus]